MYAIFFHIRINKKSIFIILANGLPFISIYIHEKIFKIYFYLMNSFDELYLQVKSLVGKNKCLMKCKILMTIIHFYFWNKCIYFTLNMIWYTVYFGFLKWRRMIYEMNYLCWCAISSSIYPVELMGEIKTPWNQSFRYRLKFNEINIYLTNLKDFDKSH